MSNSQSSDLLHFQVVAPYHIDEALDQRREAVLEKHIARLQKLRAETGIIKCGGPIMRPESLTAEEKRPVGSAFIVRALSYEAVKELVENDPFYTGEVWDKEKLMIMPFLFFVGDEEAGEGRV